MNWANLKQNQCPQCNAPIKPDGLLAMQYLCTKCPFKINHEKYDVIMSDRFKPRYIKAKGMKVEDNLLELNNDGRKEVSEDFSDSPFADRE